MLAKIALAVALVCIARAAGAGEPALPPGVSCSDVRSQVAAHGRLAARAWALAHGYSWRQIREAEKCLRG